MAAEVLCPSAQPGMQRLRLIGVVNYAESDARVVYLRERVEPDTALLASHTRRTLLRCFGSVQPVKLSGVCISTVHDVTSCTIVADLPTVAQELPVCLAA